MSTSETPKPRRDFWTDRRKRAEFREAELAETPSWYSPWGHLAGTVGVGVVVLVISLLSLESIAPLEWLVVPITFVAANLFEWHAHRNILHRRFKPFGVLYDQHTPMHHRIYRYGDMAIGSVAEFRLVLIPAAGVLGIVLAASPVATLLAWLITANVGWLFLTTVSLYVVGYEVSHLAYHLPEGHWVYRVPFMHKLKEHHARHHHPPLMQKWNFNVTVPLADWILGTIAPPDKVTKARQQVGLE